MQKRNGCGCDGMDCDDGLKLGLPPKKSRGVKSQMFSFVALRRGPFHGVWKSAGSATRGTSLSVIIPPPGMMIGTVGCGTPARTWFW